MGLSSVRATKVCGLAELPGKPVKVCLRFDVWEGSIQSCEGELRATREDGLAYNLVRACTCPLTAVTQTVLPSFPSAVRGTPAERGQVAGVLPTATLVQLVALLSDVSSV